MPPFPDLDETQPVDDGDGDSYLSGETIEIETERVMDDSILYGETQAVDDDDDDDVDDGGIETQVVVSDDDEEGIRVFEDVEDSDAFTDNEAEARVLKDGFDTQVVEDDKEETDAAEANGSKDVDSDASTDNNDVRSCKGIETQVVGDDDCDINNEGIGVAEARGSKDQVDSDASTDEGGVCSSKGLSPSGGTSKSNNGSMRSIAAVRVTSLRSSGLAAATGTACKAINNDLKSSFNSNENHSNQVNGVSEIDRSHDTTNFQEYAQEYNTDESKSGTKNPVVKKLLYEQDSPYTHVPDNTGGLSYVVSQEPGDLSQANALDVVDKFLVVNYLGLSQEANAGKSTEMVKSPPISSAKGAQILVKETDYRSPVGKTRIFEWIDSIEDDGGGEFFTRRRDSFFKVKDSVRKSHSHPPKSRHARFGLGDKGSNPTNHRKIKSFACSDSGPIRNSSLVTDKVHATETRTKKSLFKDLNEQSDSKCVEQQLEVTDVDGGDRGTYEVGPDTQMAAEAMEALVHGSPMDDETNDALPTVGKSVRRATSFNPALSGRPASSIPNLNGVSTRSKQRKMLPTKSNLESPISSISNSRGKKSFECATVKSTLQRERKKVEKNINAKSSVNDNECSVFFKGDKTLTKEAGECSNSLTFNVQLSVNKGTLQGEFHVKSTPIAHRTRLSKAVSLSKMSDTDCGKDTNVTINVRSHGAIARNNKLIAGAGRSRKTKRKCSDTASVQNAEAESKFINHIGAQDIEIPHMEDVKADPAKRTPAQLKRRRTRKTCPDKPTINEELNTPSNDIPQRNGKRKIIVKSISEILDTAKRKRRSVSAHRASEIDGLTSDGAKAMFASSWQTRSSLRSSSFKPNVENVLKNCFSGTVSLTAGSTSPLKQGVDFNCQVEVEVAKAEESPKQKLQPSGLSSTSTLKDVDAVSPVVAVQDNPRTPGNSGRSRSSIARELMRLEASSSPTSMFNMRRRKDMASVRVLFSHHLDDDIVKQQKKIMGRLGVALASSISDATHFVTDYFVRTRNMLEAMALGKPVVTHMWLESCGQASCFIDERNYILRDAKKEREIGFSMPVSLARACKNSLLQGRRVYVTPNTKPGREVISGLVKAAHGQPLERLGRSTTKDDKMPDDLLVFSCEEDYANCIPLLEKGAEIFSSELLLNGIVTQKLEFDRHRLFLDHVKRTRSTLWLRREDGREFLPVAKCT